MSMSSNLKDILSSLNKDVEQDKLLEYLNDQLSEKEQHAVETSLNEDPFASDAADGLAAFGNPQKLPPIINKLNKGLRKQIASQRRKKRRTPELSWSLYAVIILLLIAILAYVVIKELK
jgi:hypothetical protein